MPRPPEPRPQRVESVASGPGAPTGCEPLRCDQVQTLLDAWPDGETSPAELAAVERHAGACPACAEEVELARRLARDLKGLPPIPCPPAVTQAVLARAEAEAREASHRRPLPGGRPLLEDPARARRLRRLLGRWNSPAGPGEVEARSRRSARETIRLRLWPTGIGGLRSWLRPALAGAFVAALAAGALLLTHRPAPPRPSPAEVAQAELEIKLAFAYLGRVGREAGMRVRDEVVAGVILPTRRALVPEAAARPTL